MIIELNTLYFGWLLVVSIGRILTYKIECKGNSSGLGNRGYFIFAIESVNMVE